jgi:uncharacterized protein YndB with AHSA1/START domain
MTEGTIEQISDKVVFRYERRLAQPIEAVWRAITDPAEIGAWTGNRPEIELTPGGRYVTYHQGGATTAVDRVLRLDPPSLFEHTYFEQVNPGSVVTWELSPAGPGTLLVLTHVMTEEALRTAMATVAKGDDLVTVLSRNAAGWHHLLDALTARLDGDETVTRSPEDWQALRERYAKSLG